MRFNVTLVLDPGHTGLTHDDPRLKGALTALGDVETAPVPGAGEIEVDAELDSLSILGAVSDATLVVERAIHPLGGDPPPVIVRVEAHPAQE